MNSAGSRKSPQLDQALARELGAASVGGSSDQPPEQLDAAIGDPLRRQLIGAPDWDSCHVGRAELPLTQYLAAA